MADPHEPRCQCDDCRAADRPMRDRLLVDALADALHAASTTPGGLTVMPSVFAYRSPVVMEWAADILPAFLADPRTAEALARALQETILTSPDKYLGSGMGAYRTPWADLGPKAQRHVLRDAAAILAALTADTAATNDG